MKLPSTLIRNKGFSFIEVVIVIGIMATLGALSAFVGVDAYRGYQFRAQRNNIVSVLSSARQNALSNMYEVKHGVRLESGQITLFQYPFVNGASLNQVFALEGSVTLTGLTFPYDVVFDQISGNTTQATFNVINSNGKTSALTISSEGAISW